MTTAPPTARYVEHVMGMPISLALRGRHTDDAAATAAWAAAMSVLREADRVFSTYRADSYVSRLRRGEIGLEDCPAEMAEVLDQPVRHVHRRMCDAMQPQPEPRLRQAVAAK